MRGVICLKITDENVILALSSCRDIAGAAKQLGVSRQAIYNRLRKPEFRERLRQERDAKFMIANDKLTDSMASAIETLNSALYDKKCPYGVRIKAAQVIIDLTLKSVEQMEILERISAIEEQLKKQLT